MGPVHAGDVADGDDVGQHGDTTGVAQNAVVHFHPGVGQPAGVGPHTDAGDDDIRGDFFAAGQDHASDAVPVGADLFDPGAETDPDAVAAVQIRAGLGHAL